MWGVSKTRKTKRIENGDKYITLQALNQGDRDEMLDVMMDLKVGSKKEAEKEVQDEQKAGMRLGRMRSFQRVRSIIDWNLTYLDDEGNDTGVPVPLTEENIKALPPEIVSEIDAAIEELNPVGLSNERKK